MAFEAIMVAVNLINLQYCRRVAGTECHDRRSGFMFIVPLIDRNDFVIGLAG